MQTIYLHIGNFKTGSSAIQKYCNDTEIDYYYPKSMRPTHPITYTNHSKLSLTLLKEHGINLPVWFEDNVKFSDLVKELHEEILNKKNIIISSEEFFRVCENGNQIEILSKLKKSFPTFQFKIVMYIREPFSLLKSWYNQVNKDPHGSKSFINFFMGMDFNILSQKGVHDAFSEIFGHENIILIEYKLQGSEHIKNFFSSINSKQKVILENKFEVNERLNEKTLEHKRIKTFRSSVFNAIKTQGFTISDFVNKVDRINEDFNYLSNLYELEINSNLNYENIFNEYYSKLLSIKDIADISIDADIFRDAADFFIQSDIKLSYNLIKIASLLRPNGPLLKQKLLKTQSLLLDGE